jgi:hypothetical protein
MYNDIGRYLIILDHVLILTNFLHFFLLVINSRKRAKIHHPEMTEVEFLSHLTKVVPRPATSSLHTHKHISHLFLLNKYFNIIGLRVMVLEFMQAKTNNKYNSNK